MGGKRDKGLATKASDKPIKDFANKPSKESLEPLETIPPKPW